VQLSFFEMSNIIQQPGQRPPAMKLPRSVGEAAVSWQERHIDFLVTFERLLA